MRNAALAVALSLSLSEAALGCTTFCARNVFGRNYDFETGEGMLLVNKRGLHKRSMSSTPATWVAQYGSVTFNQFGRDFPMDGMNEAGLVVALMDLSATRYPDPDERPVIGVLNWIQYQLDTAGSVSQVIANCDKVRIPPGAHPLHYLVADASGDVATIEFLDGRLVVHRGDTLPVPVLANDTYDSSLAWLRQVQSRGWNAATASSLDRFARAALMLQSTTQPPVDATLSILASVAQPGSTRWSVAYDLQNRVVHYRSMTNAARRSVALETFDFGCTSPTLMLPLDFGSGDVTTSFEPYSYEANRSLMGESYAHTSFLRNTSSASIDADARHPETSSCVPPRRRRAARN